MPELFNKANYGEQFLDAETGSKMSLTKFSPFFASQFFDTHKEIFTQLLGQGVITTTMIRNARGCETLMENYFDTALRIFEEQQRRYSLRVLVEEEIPIVAEECPQDALSPPWFLSLEDSMGRLKGEIDEENKVFGEAIIEVRSIRNVGKWFLGRANLNETVVPGHFLDNPSKLIVESIGLFNFLKSFTTQDFPDIYTGMTHALTKY